MAKNIILWLSITAIAISSISQFHHHTHDGNIHIIYSILIESILDNNQVIEHCEHDAIPSSDSEECSFKLNFIGHTNNNDTSILPLVALNLIGFNTNVLSMEIPMQPLAFINAHYYKNILTHLFKTGTLGLRSPPQVTHIPSSTPRHRTDELFL